jgi:hypothetical protein
LHQNHLIYNILGYVLYEAGQALHVKVRCLYLLQLLSTVSGSIGVGLFFQITHRISGSRRVAAIGATALGVSTCWWKAATDADAYIVSAMLVLLCAWVLLKERPSWYWAGGALAAAMLTHEVIRRLDPEIESIRSHGGSVWINDATIKLLESGWLREHARGQEITIKLGNECYHYIELLPQN